MASFVLFVQSVILLQIAEPRGSCGVGNYHWFLSLIGEPDDLM